MEIPAQCVIQSAWGGYDTLADLALRDQCEGALRHKVRRRERESYAPLARALIGGLSVPVLITVFLTPAGFCPAYPRQEVSAGPINE
jgi:hypothetical protein